LLVDLFKYVSRIEYRQPESFANARDKQAIIIITDGDPKQKINAIPNVMDNTFIIE